MKKRLKELYKGHTMEKKTPSAADIQAETHKEKLEEYEKHLNALATDLRTQIKKKPLTSITIAMTIGFLIARCLNGRK